MFFVPHSTLMYIYNQYGEQINVNDLGAINRLIAMKEKHGTNYWPVVEEVLKIWAHKRPNEYKSFLVDVREMQETRRGKFAASETEMFRYTLDIPETVIFMLRKLYTAEEMPMDKKFFRSWAKKFPKMQIAEKI